MPGKVCNQKGCPALAIKRGRCQQHQPVSWEGRRGFVGYGATYMQNRAIVLKRDPLCRGCGIRPSVTADHIIPKGQGGSDDPGNMAGKCKSCHDIRSAKQATAGRYNHKDYYND